MNMHDISVTKAKTMFLESIALPHSANTQQAYRRALETFLNLLISKQVDVSSFPVAKLGEDSILQFIEYLKNLSPATESLYLQVVKGFFEFLAAQNLGTISPSRLRMLIRQRTRRSKHSSNDYPEDNVKALIDFYSSPINTDTPNHNGEINTLLMRNLRNRALILTLADTGLRVEEICRLRRGDLDWDRNRVILKGRGNKQAIVRFSTKATNAIKDYLCIREPFDLGVGRPLSTLPLFSRHDKGAGKGIKPVTPTTIRRIVAECTVQILGSESAGSITPHTFLHYFVTTILQATGNLKLAQMLARHSSIQVTQKYAHINDDELEKGYHAIFEQKSLKTHRE